MFKSRESQMIFATEETTQRFMQEKKYKLIVTINMLIRAFKSCNTIVLSSELQNIEWRLFSEVWHETSTIFRNAFEESMIIFSKRRLTSTFW